MKNKGLWIGLGAVVIVVGGAAAWYLGSPLFINRTVEEEFPTTGVDTAALDEMPAEEKAAVQAEVVATAAAVPDTEMDEPMPEAASAEPEVVAHGSFMGADEFHTGEGEAVIYRLPDGQRVLRFEDFNVINGPDLHVYLAAGSAPTGPDDLGETIDLGTLKGNVGSQNYDIPADVDVSQYGSVVIYCVPFHVVFATATLN